MMAGMVIYAGGTWAILNVMASVGAAPEPAMNMQAYAQQSGQGPLMLLAAASKASPLAQTGFTWSPSPVKADSGVAAMPLRRLEVMAEPLDTLCGDLTPQEALGESSALRYGHHRVTPI